MSWLLIWDLFALLHAQVSSLLHVPNLTFNTPSKNGSFRFNKPLKNLGTSPKHKEQSWKASSAALWRLSLCCHCHLLPSGDALTANGTEGHLSQDSKFHLPSLCAKHNLCTWTGLAGPILCTQLKEHVLTALSKKSHPFRNAPLSRLPLQSS